MKTVKEISEMTGISVRTLHYYDEIGLLRPTAKSEAGYRLYDDKALEMLQQILFFREFDIPLKEIKAVMENPALEKNQILLMQRKMLASKKERLERLIASIDEILKGEKKMDFEVFGKSDIETLFEHTLEHLPESAKEAAIKEFGSVEQWKAHYMERASQETMQRGYQKLVEWYGSKEAALDAAMAPPNQELVQACQKRLAAVLEKLNEKRKRGCPLDSFEVRESVGEYEFVMKRLYQMEAKEGLEQLMLSVADSYRHEMVRPKTDAQYGEGAAEFFAQAIASFYKRA